MIELTMDNGLLPLLSEQQLDAWTQGKIENLRFDTDNGVLTYRLTEVPDSRISFKVPEPRLEEWRTCQAMWAEMDNGTFSLGDIS